MHAIDRNQGVELRNLVGPMFLIVLAIAACAAALATGVGAELLSKAAGLPSSGGSGFERIGAISNQLQKPVLYAAFVALPLLLIIGAAAFAIGSRNGQTMIVRIIAAVVLLAIAPGLAS